MNWLEWPLARHKNATEQIARRLCASRISISSYKRSRHTLNSLRFLITLPWSWRRHVMSLNVHEWSHVYDIPLHVLSPNTTTPITHTHLWVKWNLCGINNDLSFLFLIFTLSSTGCRGKGSWEYSTSNRFQRIASFFSYLCASLMIPLMISETTPRNIRYYHRVDQLQ